MRAAWWKNTLMKILSINIARPSAVEINGRSVMTGINKQPVSGAIWLRTLGFEGDGQADLTVHGGEEQAAYSYPWEHYAHWQGKLGRLAPLPFGTFGENLTITGLMETEVCIGDVYRFGGARVQVTAPRLPCFKFGHKIGSPEILKDFLLSGFSGFYQRVLEEGKVVVGDDIVLVDRDPAAITVRAVLGLQRLGEGDSELWRRVLAIPSLAPRLRHNLEKRGSKS
jgi:MOSC domain-containing protein YiiM